MENKSGIGVPRSERIQAPRGTKDILPEEAVKWRAVEAAVHEIGRLFDYGEIRTPTFENVRLFKRAVGEETDIVSKEMYLLQSRGEEKEEFALRPELTAPVVRAAVEHGMLTGQSDCVRLYYCSAPNFRYEKPQKGRLRQHHQFGTELLGPASPLADAEIISFAIAVFRKLGLTNFRIRLNWLGTKEVRERWREGLIRHLRDHWNELSEESKLRTERNPLRVLDSKAERDQVIIANAPDISLYFSTDEEKALHDGFHSLFTSLRQIGDVEYDRKLVRGIDYYTGSVFEITSPDLGSQDALCGGGRYDDLVEQLGGPTTPAMGFGAGVERLLLALGDSVQVSPPSKQFFIKTYLVALTQQERGKAFEIASDLRASGLPALFDLNNRSMKAQMREANKANAKFVYIIGESELAEGAGILKEMQTGEQTKISFDRIVEEIKRRLPIS